MPRFITGAGSGMGKAITSLFHSEGAKVALVDRDGSGFPELDGTRGVYRGICDVSNESDVMKVVRLAAEALNGWMASSTPRESSTGGRSENLISRHGAG